MKAFSFFKGLILVGGILTVHNIQSQNVGVGTLTPQARLHITVPSNYTFPLLRVEIDGSTNPYFVVQSDGKIGIGVANPSEALDVSGNVQFSGALMPGGDAGVAGQVLVSQGQNFAPKWIDVGAGGISGICSLAATNFLQKWIGSELCNSIIYDDGNSVGIGTANPHPSAKLEIKSTSSGLLIPRMNKSQRDNIISPARGLLIYNRECDVFQYYDSVSNRWQTLIPYPGPQHSLIPTDSAVFLFDTSAGPPQIYTWVVPDTISCYIKVKLWGAGGGSGGCDVCSSPAGKGGGGGFVEVVLQVQPQDTLTIYLAEGGKSGRSGAGTPGGEGGWGFSKGGRGGASGGLIFSYSGSGGGGGGASALLWNGQLIAVAGGGGGGGGLGNHSTACGGGNGGAAGQNGQNGAGTQTRAVGGSKGIGGIPSPFNGENGASRGGDGGGGGGGGGGYSGGRRGLADSFYDDSGGAGGGGGASWVAKGYPVISYRIVNGNGPTPGNANDPSLAIHCPDCARGGDGPTNCPNKDGGNGFAIIYW